MTQRSGTLQRLLTLAAVLLLGGHATHLPWVLSPGSAAHQAHGAGHAADAPLQALAANGIIVPALGVDRVERATRGAPVVECDSPSAREPDCASGPAALPPALLAYAAVHTLGAVGIRAFEGAAPISTGRRRALLQVYRL